MEARGKYDKRPVSARDPSRGVSTNRLGEWSAFKVAFEAYRTHGLGGMGMVVTGLAGLITYDLDKCRDENGVIAVWAMDIVRRLTSYTEISPSGRGLRIFAHGWIDGDWVNHSAGVECYGGHAGRFLTVTGHHLAGTPMEICHVSDDTHASIRAEYGAKGRGAEAEAEGGARIINLVAPDTLDPLTLPDTDSMELPSGVSYFLRHGIEGGAEEDRSRLLFAAGVSLCSQGWSPLVVYSLLVNNSHVWEIAMDKRRGNATRAREYIWREHVLKAQVKAAAAMTTSDDFDVELDAGMVGAGVCDAETREGVIERCRLPAFERDNRGRILPTRENLRLALSTPEVLNMRVQYDTFLDDVQVGFDGGAFRALRDVDYVEIALRAERMGFKHIPQDLLSVLVEYVAHERTVDSAKAWLDGMPEWDGIPRVERFLADYMKAEDTPYTQAVGRYLWTALAARVMDPGCKADMIPILVGDQGVGKTRSLRAMVGGYDKVGDMDLSIKTDGDAPRLARGRLIMEIAELKGLRNASLEHIKAYVSQTEDTYRPKYRERTVTRLRRHICIGTTNENDFLADITGNRRWLPVTVGEIDVEGIEAIHPQLWAEAVARYLVWGIEYRDAEILAREQHAEFRTEDPWEASISEWLSGGDSDESDIVCGPDRSKGYVTTYEVLRYALRMETSRINRAAETRVGYALKGLGLTRKRIRINGVRAYVYTFAMR